MGKIELPLGHHLDQISEAQLVAQVPTHAQDNHLAIKMSTSEQLFDAFRLPIVSPRSLKTTLSDGISRFAPEPIVPVCTVLQEVSNCLSLILVRTLNSRYPFPHASSLLTTRLPHLYFPCFGNSLCSVWHCPRCKHKSSPKKRGRLYCITSRQGLFSRDRLGGHERHDRV